MARCRQLLPAVGMCSVHTLVKCFVLVQHLLRDYLRVGRSWRSDGP